MIKRCPTCDTTYKDAELHFAKHAGRYDGVAGICKKCFRERSKEKSSQKRQKKYDEKFAFKRKAKDLVKYRYKAKDFKCCVLSCEENATDLHHVTYQDPYAVIPLCKKHHKDEHYLNGKVE